MNSHFQKRYVPLAIWIVAIFTIIAVPFKIISYGFLPMDDALRHAAYEPWVKKIRPPDRMILRGSGGSQPDVPELEWHYAASGLWIGRLPESSTTDGTPK